MKHAETSPSSVAPHRRAILATAIVGLCGVAVAGWFLFGDQGRNGNAEAAASTLKLEDIPFDGARAYESLKQLIALGPRPSGSPAMVAQQKLLVDHFEKCGAQIEYQRFRVPDPRTGKPVPMTNILARWNPKEPKRILLCAHYDTLPYPLEDPLNPRGRFVGANDNASGVAVLMELARELSELKSNYGIDILMIDGEEYIFQRGQRMYLGSEYFAREYAKLQAKKRPPYRYHWGVLLDMIGDTDLQLYQERNSVWWRDTRPLVDQIWATAARLGVREFIAKPKDEMEDDHLMLHNVGNIPCIDIIDFGYPPWHTEGDTADKCSPLSLAKVGWVVREWLKTVK